MSKLNWHRIKAWWFDPTAKRLGYAVLLSVLVHFLLIEQLGSVAISKFSSVFQTIDAELMAPPKIAVTDQQLTEAPPMPKPAPTAQAVPADVSDDSVTKPVSESVPSETQLNETVAPESGSPEALPQTAVEAAVRQELDEQQATVLPDIAEDAEKPQPFIMVETNFDVLMNHSLERVGTAKIRYVKSNDQTYALTWSVSAAGLIGLVYPDLLQTSQGTVTESGLQPDAYLYKFGTRESKSYQASFNWVEREVALQSIKGTKKVAMAGDAATGHLQDFLSFMYQFMFSPPLEDMQIYLTNGRKLGLYQYAFEGEETLALKFANVKTYHIQHAKADSEDKTELWLAIEYKYVPVKIRKTEKDGTVIEQVATKLKFETIEKELPLP